jgi:GNAT superfamily N-acetyltransferase
MFTTRPVAPKDFPAVARLLNAAYELVGVNLMETPETVKERADVAIVIVAEVAGVVAATMTLAPAGSKYATLAGKGQMEASRLAVDPLFQSRGLGASMLNTVIATCRRHRVQALVGVSLNSMSTAHHLYESAGATAIGPGAKARGYTLDLTDDNEKDN